MLLALIVLHASGQVTRQSNEIVITGARFTYPLFEKWIADYRDANPSVTIRIEPRTSVDPEQYDILIEAFEHEGLIKDDREYLYLGRYAVIPVANASSTFAKKYAADGLTTAKVKQIFFHDIYASKDEESRVSENFSLYTRLQKAGAPKTFARHFGFDQQNITGKSIAGADEHLIRAILKDTLGVSYSIPSLIYDLSSRKPLKGLSVLPLDADGNGRVSKDEKTYENLDEVLARIESGDNVQNIPTEYFHISIRKHGPRPEALKFLNWIIENSQDDLHQFGFLKPEQKRFDSEKQKFQQLAIKK